MANNFYDEITTKIIAAIEAGAGTYEMPWNKQGANFMVPVNASTGAAYKGVNIVSLWASSDLAGFQSNEWATYNQWTEMGAQVRKGEKSSRIVWWSPTKEDGKEKPDDLTTEKDGRRFIAKSHAVFNAGQVDGYEPKIIPAKKLIVPGERIPEAEAFFKHLGADIRHGGDRAFYRPSDDFIQMPLFESFHEVQGYYSVLAHEATHWTGAKRRMDRDLSGRFGNEKYAMEELIAELGAAYTMGNLGLSNEPRKDHAGYIESWLKVLKSDSKAIFTASAKAQAAADFMLNKQPTAEHVLQADTKAKKESKITQIFMPLASQKSTTSDSLARKSMPSDVAIIKPRWDDLSISQQYSYEQKINQRSAVRFIGIGEAKDTPGVVWLGFTDLLAFDLDKADQSEWFPVDDESTTRILKNCQRGDILVIERDTKIKNGEVQAYIKSAHRVMEPKKYSHLAITHEGFDRWQLGGQEPTDTTMEDDNPTARLKSPVL